MLGQPISMLLPEVVGFEVDRRQLMRRHDGNRSGADRDRNAPRPGRGRQVRRILRPGSGRAATGRTVRPSPTWRPNTARPADFSRSIDETLRLSAQYRPRSTPRPSALVEAYAKANGMWRGKHPGCTVYTDTLSTGPVDDVEPSLAGPKRPQDRVPLDRRQLSAFRQGPGPSDSQITATPRRRKQLARTRRRLYRSKTWRCGDRRDHLLHQHLEPVCHGRRRAGRAQRRRL